MLRRPPLSTVLPTAHDMRREHRVMTALASTDVPVPRTLALCTDESVVGAPFYVMERVHGHIVRDSLPPGYADAPEQRHAIGIGFVDVLATCTRSTRSRSASATTAGRTDTWSARSAGGPRSGRRAGRPRSRTDRSSTGSAARLRESLPPAPSGPIVHGDYRLDNALLAPDAARRVAAVLDWELSTLGDPFADLGLLYVYWPEPDDGRSARARSRSTR